MPSSCTSSSSSDFFPARCFFWWRNKCKSLSYYKQQQFVCEFPLDVYLLRWEIVWRNAPRIWRDFGSALPFQTRLIQTKPVLPLSNEHGSQVKDQGRRQCCHKHNKFSYQPTRDVSLLCGHASCMVWRAAAPLCLSRCGFSADTLWKRGDIGHVSGIFRSCVWPLWVCSQFVRVYREESAVSSARRLDSVVCISGVARFFLM